jgi:hypothetical protein
LNWGVGSFESLEREGVALVALPRCAAWASRKSFVLATAKSSRREVAASNLYTCIQQLYLLFQSLTA